MNVINQINRLLKSKFTLLFITLIIYIVLFPYLSHTFILKFAALLLSLLIFIAVIFAIPQKKSYVITFVILALSTLMFNCAYIITASTVFRILNGLGFLSLISVAIYLFTKEIMQHKTVTRDILIGSICEYLLIGMWYGFIFSLIESLHPGSFVHTHTQTPPTNPELLYFSYITLTTLGYGDIVSTSMYSKSFVIFESITGVFYIAILVSRLVSAMGKPSN